MVAQGYADESIMEGRVVRLMVEESAVKSPRFSRQDPPKRFLVPPLLGGEHIWGRS